MEIEYPNNYKASNYTGQFLCRYLDLYKLLDIINNHQIYFTRLDKFDDPLEGLTANAIKLRLFTQRDPITEKNINKLFSPEDQKRIIQDDKIRREQYKREVAMSQKSQFANCWFKGEKESIAMWRLYSKKEGVIIKFEANELIDTILQSVTQVKELENTKMTFGDVDYKNIWPFDLDEVFDNKFNAMKKDKSYLHENEFRFIIAVSGGMIDLFDNIILPINSFNNMNFEILASPFMEKWEFLNLAKLLSKYDLEKRLRQSNTAIKR